MRSRPNFATDPTFREASCTTTVAKDMLQQVDIAYFTAVGVFRRPPRPELFGFNQRAKQEHRAEDAGKGTGVNQPCSSVQSRESSKTADSARAWSWGRGAGHLCKTGLVCKGVVLSAAKLLAKPRLLCRQGVTPRKPLQHIHGEATAAEESLDNSKPASQPRAWSWGRREGRSKNMIFLDVCVKHAVSVKHLQHVFFCESAFCLVGRCAFTHSMVFA